MNDLTTTTTPKKKQEKVLFRSLRGVVFGKTKTEEVTSSPALTTQPHEGSL